MNLPPYERVVQWLAGPFAALVGIIATKAVSHLSWLGAVGLQGSSVAHAIVTGSVFVATAGVTYAAHHKWLTNLAKWWQTSGLTSPAVVEDSQPPLSPPTVAPPPSTPDEVLRAQLRAAGIEPSA